MYYIYIIYYIIYAVITTRINSFLTTQSTLFHNSDRLLFFCSFDSLLFQKGKRLVVALLPSRSYVLFLFSRISTISKHYSRPSSIIKRN